MNDMKEYLEQRAQAEASLTTIAAPYNYYGLCDFVLDRGREPTSAKLTEEQLEYLLKVAKACNVKFVPKQCYHNAMMLTIVSAWFDPDVDQRIKYVEGFCYSGVIPVQHAWIELDGKPVDLTRSTRPEASEEFWEGKDPQEDLLDRVLGVIPDGWAYLGAEFSYDDVVEYVTGYEETNSLIENWRDGFPYYKLERIKPRSPNTALAKHLAGG